MKFRKQKMIDRLTQEGKADQITKEIEEIMDDLDGQEVDTQCWDRQVKGEPVYWCVGKSGKGEYVHELDVE
jgi:hypothetical protein